MFSARRGGQGKKIMNDSATLRSAGFWIRSRTWALALSLGGAMLLVAAPNLRAATYYVATTGNNGNPGSMAMPFLTIGHAVSVSVHGDSIQVAAGTYSESFTIPGTNLNLIGAGAATTTINGSIQTNTGFVLTMSGFTVQNGGLSIFQMACNLNDCIFRNNGTGVSIQTNAFVNINNCAFNNNTGPGISTGSNPGINNCTFTGNSNCGIYLTSGSPTITNCTFTGNSSGPFDGGGGIRNGSGTSRITNCAFINNNGSGNGGGIYNTFNNAIVTNCLFIGNSGGAIVNSGANPTITNCTFSGNSGAPSGTGGIFNFSSSPILTNCILWGNSGWDIFNQGGATTVTYSDIQSGFGGTGNIAADPLFVNPGGGNYRLQANSPCIDSGNNAAITAGADLAGHPRFVEAPCVANTGAGTPPLVDRGAYEYTTGDIDGNGFGNLADIPSFVAVLLGTDTIPAHVAAADMNCDGLANGLDAQGFANRIQLP